MGCPKPDWGEHAGSWYWLTQADPPMLIINSPTLVIASNHTLHPAQKTSNQSGRCALAPPLPWHGAHHAEYAVCLHPVQAPPSAEARQVHPGCTWKCGPQQERKTTRMPHPFSSACTRRLVLCAQVRHAALPPWLVHAPAAALAWCGGCAGAPPGSETLAVWTWRRWSRLAPCCCWAFQTPCSGPG